MNYLILFFVLFSQLIISQTLLTSDPKESFPLVSCGKAAAIYVEDNNYIVVGIAARHLSNDIFNVSGKRPVIINSDKMLSCYGDWSGHNAAKNHDRFRRFKIFL